MMTKFCATKFYVVMKTDHIYHLSIYWVHRCGPVVACALVTHRARVRSPVGIGFLAEVFFRVFPHL